MAAAQDRYAEMLGYLTTRGAEVCLVSFPVTQAYRTATAQMDSAGHDQAIAFFTALADQSGARFVDARAQVQPDHLFRDVDHLNAEGAAGFYPDLMQGCFGS